MDAVLFDLDGTLIDTTSAILASLQHTVWYFTGEKPEPEHFRPYIGMTLDDVLSSLVPDHAQEAKNVYIEHNLSVHDELVKAFPEAVETIERLRQMGISLAVVTSKRRHSAEVGMRIARLSGLFDAEVYFEDTEHHKPHPAPLLKALDLLAVRSGKVLMVGDTSYDIQAAKNANEVLKNKEGWNVEIQSAGAAYGPSGRDALSREHPDHLIDSLTELIAICERTR